MIVERFNISEFISNHTLFPLYIDYVFAGIQNLSGKSPEEKTLLRVVIDLLASSAKQNFSLRHLVAHASRLSRVQFELHDEAQERFKLMDILANMIEYQTKSSVKEEFVDSLLKTCDTLRDQYVSEARLKRLIKQKMLPASITAANASVADDVQPISS